MSDKQRIRLGMIGGGDGSFMGGVHRMAARLDDRYQLVAGVFSSRSEPTGPRHRRSALKPNVVTPTCPP